MKLLIFSSIFLSSSLSLASSIIKPVESDRVFTFENKNHLIMRVNNRQADGIIKTEYNPCRYNINDYRLLKNGAVGCAVNNNRKKSIANGDVCN
ncbi:hypothetical protein [Yersinia aleksiciae]|uniref:Lipoprotein n=1 Tax=Yersinia aleksiciae TaxID=263819 RepID=A0A0T9U596_YERAE|nr:hypothetical protein [Yersinia aleksiciae]AKP33142.1 hypothetical protein ACZ76_06085 [Yersinia aleksiciae]CFQ49016.1 Uncharacterised protein [Yersinia aleksiciae]CNL20544.1 Uncharacterised protein [Yersinia aleksiciae]